MLLLSISICVPGPWRDIWTTQKHTNIWMRGRTQNSDVQCLCHQKLLAVLHNDTLVWFWAIIRSHPYGTLYSYMILHNDHKKWKDTGRSSHDVTLWCYTVLRSTCINYFIWLESYYKKLSVSSRWHRWHKRPLSVSQCKVAMCNWTEVLGTKKSEQARAREREGAIK